MRAWTRHWRVLSIALGLAYLASLACEASLDSAFEGKACDKEGRCAAGFFCDPLFTVCRRAQDATDSGDTTGSGGSGAAAVHTDSGSNTSGAAGVGGWGGHAVADIPKDAGH